MKSAAVSPTKNAKSQNVAYKKKLQYTRMNGINVWTDVSCMWAEMRSNVKTLYNKIIICDKNGVYVLFCKLYEHHI